MIGQLSKQNTSIAAIISVCTLFILLDCKLIAQSGATDGSTLSDSQRIESLIDKLDAENYSARQLAYLELKTLGIEALPAIEQRLPGASLSSATAMVRLLSEMRPEGSSEAGIQSLEVLRKTAGNRLTFAGSLASRTLDAIALKLRLECERRLRELGATVDVGLVQVISYPSEIFHLQLDEQFTGSPADLDILLHFTDMENVVLSGDKINAEILEKIALLPDLKYLQLKKVRLTNRELESLRKFPAIDTLEIVYCRMSDDNVDTLASIGGLSQLSLFGTGLSQEASERLRDKAKQLELVFHNGGFLGIRSRDQNGIMIDQVVQAGPAEKAGILSGDRIIRMNGQSLAKFEDLRLELSKFGPGDSVSIVFERSFGQQSLKHEVTVELGERP